MINAVRPRSGKVDMQKVVDHFNRRCRAVRLVPFDPHLEEGAEISLERLSRETRKALIELAGLSDKLAGPHDLRRNFATYYSRQRRGEAHGQALSKQLGHASYRMTSQYNLQDAEDLREAMASPFALMESSQ